ncbi:MAG TPA: prenyltransferase/squalene oxidase repeat-containing protein [Solirubrobacteraceae bacterium]|nr:prenyltransferase/squalene oxidase repeat-containing protein [Solirubrobacteraceae bacterium]
MSWQLAAFGLLAVALAGGFYWYERSRPDARIVALVGTLAAFAALGRIAFAAVPNVKPTTDIVLIAGYALGGGPGFAVGALAGLSSNFFFGQGPWTPWQMAAWGATGVIGAGLGRLMRRGSASADAPPAGGPGGPARVIGRWPLAIICCVTGFAFTVFQDVGDWVTYSDHSLGQLGAYVGQGLGFDAVHAGGCVVFALAIGPALIRSIQRFARRLTVTWLPAGSAGGGAACAVGVAAAVAAMAAPAHAAVTAPPRLESAAINYLLGAENANGGFGAAVGQPSDQLYTGWAGLGLAAAGRDLNLVSHGGQGLMAYVRSAAGSPGDVGSLERLILVAGAAGQSPRRFGGHDLVTELERRIRPDGSVSDQVNLTAFAILALRAAGAGGSDLGHLRRWLSAQQNRDGGFDFGTRGGSSDVDDTGAALEALAGDGAAEGIRARAVAYVRAHQNRDGGFPSQPGMTSNAQSTAWAIQGLDGVGVSPASVHRNGSPSPLTYLDSLAAPSGLIRYARGLVQTPVWVTGEALMAMEAKPLPVAAPPAPAAATPAPRVSAHTHTRAHRAGPAATGAASGSGASGRPPRRPRARRPGGSAAAAGAAATARLAATAGVITAVVLAPVGLG